MIAVQAITTHFDQRVSLFVRPNLGEVERVDVIKPSASGLQASLDGRERATWGSRPVRMASKEIRGVGRRGGESGSVGGPGIA